MSTFGWTAVAHASGDAEAASASGGLMGVLVLLGMVGLAYMITHYILEGFQRRVLVVTGVEYILLGALLGPAQRILDPLARAVPVSADGRGLGLEHQRTGREHPTTSSSKFVAVKQ